MKFATIFWKCIGEGKFKSVKERQTSHSRSAFSAQIHELFEQKDRVFFTKKSGHDSEFIHIKVYLSGDDESKSYENYFQKFECK